MRASRFGLIAWRRLLRRLGERRLTAALLLCLLGSTWFSGALSHTHPVDTSDAGCLVEQLQAHVGPTPVVAPLALAPVAPPIQNDLPCVALPRIRHGATPYRSRAPPASS